MTSINCQSLIEIRLMMMMMMMWMMQEAAAAAAERGVRQRTSVVSQTLRRAVPVAHQ